MCIQALEASLSVLERHARAMHLWHRVRRSLVLRIGLSLADPLRFRGEVLWSFPQEEVQESGYWMLLEQESWRRFQGEMLQWHYLWQRNDPSREEGQQKWGNP